MPKQQIEELFDYKNGHLYWKNLPRKPKGLKAGRLMPSGYIIIHYKKKRYREHRLVWNLFNGDLPAGKWIDHLNRERADNRIENLRVVTTSENARNMRLHTRSSTGVRGVYFDKGMKKYCARIYTEPYKMIVLGYSESLEEAAKMRREAEKVYGYL